MGADERREERRDEALGLGDSPGAPPVPSPQGDGHPGEGLWPATPMCHDRDALGQRVRAAVWRPARGVVQDSPYAETFRSCSFCGSMHPEDLYRHLTTTPGAALGGSDWKYGWPHKFYVKGLPNPVAGQQVPNGWRSWSDVTCPCGTVYPSHTRRTCPSCGLDDFAPGVGYTPRSEVVMGPAPALLFAKWYNQHLDDLSTEAFALLAPLLEQHAGIAFTRDAEGRVAWRAPSAGYQR